MVRRIGSWPLFVLVFFAWCSPAWAGDPFSVSVTQERTIGKEVAGELEGKMAVSTDPVLNSRLRNIGRRLAEYSGRSDLRYEFKVIQHSEINAFALPGGYVYCYQGLMQALPSDDALAFVLAHEITHCSKRHWANMYAKAVRLSVLTLGYGNLLNLFLVPHYSRTGEREADMNGMRMACQAGYSPGGAVDALMTLKKLAGSGKSGMKIFRSHPDTDSRIKILQDEAARIKEETKNAPPNSTVQPDLGAAALLIDSAAAAQSADTFGITGWSPARNELLPLATGWLWRYQSMDKSGKAVSYELSIVEEMPGGIKGVYKARATYAGGISTTFLIATTDKAVMRRQRPRDESSKWETWVALADGVSGFKSAGTQKVTVPFGTLEATKIEKLDDSATTIAEIWLARGVGIVKQRNPGRDEVEVLVSLKKP